MDRDMDRKKQKKDDAPSSLINTEHLTTREHTKKNDGSPTVIDTQTQQISTVSTSSRRGKSGPSTVTPSMLYPHQAFGPSTGTKKKESEIDTSRAKDGTNEHEKPKIFDGLKRTAPRENIVTDGKINIVSKIDSKREALCCKYNEEYDYIAVGYSDGVIRMYQSDTSELVFTLYDSDVKDNRAPVTSIKHRPVSKIYPVTHCYTGTYANGCVKCWSYNFNQCLYTIKEKRQTFGIVYHPRFPKFVTFGDDMKVLFYDEETKTQERILTCSDNPEVHDGQMSRVFAACFHPKNNYELLTGGWDDVVQFWDLRQPHAIRHLSGVHMCGEGIDINQKGTEILTCSWQKEDPLQVFDYGSAKRLYCLEPDIFTSKLYCGKYVTKDFVVCAGTDPNLLRVVDLQTTAEDFG
ncbi:uncharacterized protein LOC115875530 isoform X2 [Sitophilus oryzae]|uniref:Uncharacterized protein LOC115875530 isoform X2 n=1 Tax=Sitophilus oryzae TaxID=7048 RepID=A0A6J2X7N0_SITOR|nr:uncharacterized protein LOC115875530 isoform X2 [Sitophilus oryzae]